MQTQTTTTRASAPPFGSLLSSRVIPAVRGRFYSYCSELTPTSPLYSLMDCKANKSRPVSDAAIIASEIDLTFLFGNTVQVCSPNALPSIRLLEHVTPDRTLNETRITRTNMTEDAFGEVRRRKNGSVLAQICLALTVRKDAVLELSVDGIYAVTTVSGKYGLFLVEDLTPSSVKIEACHILL
jgi:hypothetical protein